MQTGVKRNEQQLRSRVTSRVAATREVTWFSRAVNWKHVGKRGRERYFSGKCARLVALFT